MRNQGLVPDYGHIDLQLCDQLHDVVSGLGLAKMVSPFRIVAA